MALDEAFTNGLMLRYFSCIDDFRDYIKSVQTRKVFDLFALKVFCSMFLLCPSLYYSGDSIQGQALIMKYTALDLGLKDAASTPVNLAWCDGGLYYLAEERID
jgi:hypothetical protein